MTVSAVDVVPFPEMVGLHTWERGGECARKFHEGMGRTDAPEVTTIVMPL